MGHGNEAITLDYPPGCYHDPYDVDRLIRAARRSLDAQVGETHPRECYQAFVELSAALDAFPEEPEALSPLLRLAPAEPIPPGGGRWASASEYRRHVEATTLSAAEFARYAAGRKHH